MILNVPKYDFNWQLGYELKQPMHLPKGTRIVAHFDGEQQLQSGSEQGSEVG